MVYHKSRITNVPAPMVNCGTSYLMKPDGSCGPGCRFGIFGVSNLAPLVESSTTAYSEKIGDPKEANAYKERIVLDKGQIPCYVLAVQPEVTEVLRPMTHHSGQLVYAPRIGWPNTVVMFLVSASSATLDSSSRPISFCVFLLECLSELKASLGRGHGKYLSYGPAQSRYRCRIAHEEEEKSQGFPRGN